MDDNSSDRLTLARRFLEPSNSTHRQYEALRAFFVDGVPSAQAAAQFGYTPGSFRALVHQFRAHPGRDFFMPTARQGRPPGKQKRLRDRVVALRKQNLSVHDISLRSPATARPSARRQSRRSWRKKALPSCRDGGTRSDPITLVPPWPTPLTSGSSICRHGTSAQSSAVCSCSCRIWSRPIWTRSWLVAASPARR